MKKYIITSASFTGEVYAIYSSEGLVQQIDFSAAQCSQEQVQWLKTQLPAVGNPYEAIKHKNINVVDEDLAITFDMFWEQYKMPFNRKRCVPKWNRLSKAEQTRAYAGITAYDRYLKHNSWQNKAHPDTYLTDKYWQNEWNK